METKIPFWRPERWFRHGYPSSIFSTFTHMEQLPLWAVFGGYAIFTLGIAYGWWRALFRSRGPLSPAPPPATVLVPFRNEAARLQPLIRSIKQAAEVLPDWEFLFLNDHSDDGSETLLQTALAEFPQVQVLDVPPGLTGKKAALQFGVEQSRNPYLITTDADCSFAPAALQHMVAALLPDQVKLVCGPVIQHSGNGFGALLADLEFLSLMGSGIAFWGMGVPIMGNGAFLGFRKEAFWAVNGFVGNENYPGGDDVFLLHKIREKFGNRSIRFITSGEDVVQTAGDGSWREFLQRRIRWGAKAKAYQSAGARAITFFTLLVQSATVVCMMGLLLSAQWHIVLCALLLKLACDLLVLVPIMAHFRQWRLLPFILPASPLHPFYLFFTACLSLRGQYEWKKRTYGH